MSERWGSLLTPGSRIAAVFEGELRQHLAAEYEEDDELVKHVIDQLKEVETQQKLHAEFVEVFDDGAEDMASWCWNKMQHLSTEPQEEAIDSAPEELLGSDLDDDLDLEGEGEEGELPEDDELGSGGAEAQLDAEQQQQPGKKPKREPIKFDLKAPAADTAPHKSSRKFKPQPAKPAEQHKADNRAAPPAAAAAAAPLGQPLHRADTARSRAEVRSKETPRRAAAAVKGALDAAVKSAAAPTRPARVSDSVSSKEQPVAAAAERLARSPGAGESRSQDRDRGRPHHDRDRDRRNRDSTAAATDAGATGRLVGSKRSAVDAVGRGLFGRAFQQLAGAAERSTRAERPDRAAGRRQQQQEPERQQQQEPERQQEPRQQQRRQLPPEQERSRPGGHEGRLSVLQRLGAKEQQEHDEKASKHKNVFERLGVPPGDKPATTTAAAAAAPAAGDGDDDVPKKQQQVPKTPQQSVPQQDAGAAPVAASSGGSKAQRPSVYERLGAGAAAAGVDLARQQQPAKQTAAHVTSTPAPPVAVAAPAAAGVKRKAEASNGNAAANTGAVAAAPAAKKPAAAAAAVPTAVPTAGSGLAKPGKAATKAAELAKMRAMIEAKAAEVKRLQQAKQQAEQQAEADKRSVAVFGVPHGVPESVLRAHFAVCGTIKRLTPRPGGAPHLPGAYVEYETTKAALQALGLTGTVLLPNCPMLTVQIKHDYDQNRIRGQKSFAALQKSATASASAGNRNWVNTTAVAVPNSTAPAPASGEPESPASLGDMGLI